MTWHHYQLSYRLHSPLRIGGRETGNLLSTLPYVPGRVLWAALTARVTRDRGLGRNGGAYQKVGDEIQKNLRFGYLWPSMDGKSPFYRWQDPAEFEYLFLNSYVSTALSYPKQSALDGSLHEAEYIAPVTREGNPVFLVGELWVNDGYASDDWKKALQAIQLGGERRYGWGRVKLETLTEAKNGDGISDPGNFAWNEMNVMIPAHVEATTMPEATIQGRVEPLIGWEISDTGKKRLSSHMIAYAPGALVKKPENNAATFRVGDMGIWFFNKQP